MLVTGASGFVGSHLVGELLSRGYEVIGIDRRSPHADVTAASNLAEALHNPAFRHIATDLVDDDLSSAVTGCAVVFHLAAVPGVRESWGHGFDRYVRNNIVATQRVLAACEAGRVRRLVFASSSSVYGPASCQSCERDLAAPVSPYGVTKLAAEQLCLAYAQRTGGSLAVSVLRYFTVYGPRQRPDMMIGRTLLASLSGVPLTLFGDGTQRRDFTYVSDVVTATVAAADVDDPAVVINIGGGSNVSMLELFQTAADVTGRPVPLSAGCWQPGDLRSTWADLTVARTLLEYRPTVGLRRGMSRQVDWLCGLDLEDTNAFRTRRDEALGTSP